MKQALLVLALAFAFPCAAQDAKAWLDKENLEALETKNVEDIEIVVARIKGAKNPKDGEDRVIVFAPKGKQGLQPVWQSNPKETDPGSKWTLHSVGRDLNGDGKPDMHFSSHSGGPQCCTTHHVLALKPQVRRLAAYSAGSVGGGEFIDVPGRKLPVMISADDSSANAFAPYANSYFPVMILEVGNKGRLQFARDMMQSRLPGQPPPICATPVATANPWLKERCGEYTGPRRTERTKQIKARLESIKASRSADKLKWEDYFENGVLAAVSAEMNRFTYTGHGNAAYQWLEQIWPGNDAVKVKFIQTLRQTQAKSAFAPDIHALASDYR
ncbi:MAG TPA: hypothetical protein VFV90_04140 [Usitatibacter sp.]|nr:hypothetical protein [Usitatibacter sp.]